MVIFVEQKSYTSVVETPEEQAMPDVELKNRSLAWLKSLRGKVYINKATGIPIEINREIKDEMMTKIHVNPSKRRMPARIKMMALKLIPYFLMDSDPDTLYEPDYQDRRDVEFSHLFKYECRINNIRFLVKIRTRKRYSTENRLYFLSFEDLDLTEK
jgi:hypothetical protein